MRCVRDDPPLRDDPGEKEEFGGTIGVIYFMALLPGSVLGLFLLCDETFCVFTMHSPVKKYFLIRTSYHVMAFVAVIGFAAVTAFLTALPFGGRTIRGLETNQGKLAYVLNGSFTAFIIIAFAFVLEEKGVPVRDFIMLYRYPLYIASYICGLILSIFIHIRSYSLPDNRLNPHCKGKGWIYSFFMGRELNPRFFGTLDLKIFVVRFTLIGSVSGKLLI